MPSTRCACSILLILATASVVLAANTKWVISNATNFCTAAEKCIKSSTEEDMQPEIINFKVPEFMRSAVCLNHTVFCESVNNLHGNATLLMRRDESQFCRLIRQCYFRTLITSSTVEPSHFCPYSDFCQHDSSLLVQNPETEASCCMSCSCEESCGKENNCCYKHNNTYNAIDTEELQCIRIDQLRDKPFGFLMRDKCKNETKCTRPNGPIIPATSQIKRRIYVSKECGGCNEADDVESWQMMTSCMNDHSLQMYLAGNDVAGCETNLYPPSSNVNTWIGDFICPDEVISQCDPDYKNSAVINKCQEVDAKVRISTKIKGNETYYANVYCVACNFVLNYVPAKVCSVLFQSFEQGQRGPAKEQLNILLDMTTLEAHQQRNKQLPSENSCGPHTVKSINLHQPGCRPVLCPSGMLRTDDGSCKYVARLWFNVVSMIELSLRPVDGMAIPAKLLRNMTGATSLAPWLVSPCSTTFDIDLDLCLRADNQSQEAVVDELAIRVYSAQEKTDPEEYLSRFKSCLNSFWKLDLDGNIFHVKASFLRSELLGPPGIAFLPGYDNISVYNECEYIIKGKTHFNSYMEKQINTRIKALYYCDQIELHSNETELGDYSIRLVHNNLTLGENYFDIYNNEDGNVARVCKEDYLHAVTMQTGIAPSCTVGFAMSLIIVSAIYICL